MKEKPLLPTLREKKRYLVYEVISDYSFTAKAISEAIKNSLKDYVGNLGLGNAGLMFFDNKFNKDTNRGLVRVTNTSLNELRASLVFINEIDKKEATVKSVIASGMIKKASKYLTAA